MIDREARDLLALHIRRLASGRISTSRFTSRAIRTRTKDPAVIDIYEAVDLRFGEDLNLWATRLAGNWKLTRRWKRYLARCVLFLRSDQEYGWPDFIPVVPWIGKTFVWDGHIKGLHDVLTMPIFVCGCEQRAKLSWAKERRMAAHTMGPGRFSWPFASRMNLEDARACRTYLCGSRASA